MRSKIEDDSRLAESEGVAADYCGAAGAWDGAKLFVRERIDQDFWYEIILRD